MRLWFNQSDSFSEALSTSPTTIKANKRQIVIIVLKWILTATICGIITFFTIFGIDFNARIYPKDFLASPRPASGNLSSTCKNTFASSTPTHYGIIPSVPVKEDDVCFDYAALIQPISPSNTTFHTYWSTQLSRQLTENQLASLRSFAATQSPQSQLFVWISPADLPRLLQKGSLWHTIHSDNVHYKTIDSLFTDTPFQKNQEEEALVKLAALYKHGGVWFDLDVVFVRDVSPLLHQPWMSQSDCHERSQFASETTVDNRFSGSLMYFEARSPYLCEMMAAASDELHGHTGLSKLQTLGSHLYARVYYRLMHHRVAPWAILPWCFTEPTQCKKSNSLPSLFDHQSNFDKTKLSHVFTIRYYKKWYSSQGSIFKYLDNQYKQSLKW